jgi:hypothetical protein
MGDYGGLLCCSATSPHNCRSVCGGPGSTLSACRVGVLSAPLHRMTSFTGIRERLEDVRILSAGALSLLKLFLGTMVMVNLLAGATGPAVAGSPAVAYTLYSTAKMRVRTLIVALLRMNLRCMWRVPR